MTTIAPSDRSGETPAGRGCHSPNLGRQGSLLRKRIRFTMRAVWRNDARGVAYFVIFAAELETDDNSNSSCDLDRRFKTQILMET